MGTVQKVLRWWPPTEKARWTTVWLPFGDLYSYLLMPVSRPLFHSLRCRLFLSFFYLYSPFQWPKAPDFSSFFSFFVSANMSSTLIVFVVFLFVYKQRKFVEMVIWTTSRWLEYFVLLQLGFNQLKLQMNWNLIIMGAYFILYFKCN